MTAAIACLGPAWRASAQPVATASPTTQSAAPAKADDIAMPDDLGAPMAGAPAPADAPRAEAGAAAGTVGTLSVNTPISVIAATPKGKAVLEHELPGLCERPEYIMFRTMSPAKLALLSNGRISQAKLTRLQQHLVQVSVAEPVHHNLLSEGGTRVKKFSRAVYRKVLNAIDSL